MAVAVMVLAWLSVAFKARGALRREAPPARRALWIALVALAAGWSVRVPAGYLWVDVRTGVPNLAQLVGDVLALSTACAILSMLLLQTNELEQARRKIWIRVAALVIASSAMGLAFGLAPVGTETDDFITTYANVPLFRLYMLIYLTYVGFAFFDLTRISRRFAKVSDRRFLTLGMRFIEAAGVFGLMYVGLRVGYLGAVWADDASRLGAYGVVSRAVVGAVSAFAVTGAVLPAIGNRIEMYHNYRQLYPLWAALYRSTPGIALSPPSPVGERLALLSERDLRFRLRSRIIEIRDGRLALRPHFRPDVAERAEVLARSRGIGGDELSATVEAATLAAAVQGKALGHEIPGDVAIAPAPAPGEADLAGEVTWLRKVTRAYTRSSVVRESTRRGPR